MLVWMDLTQKDFTEQLFKYPSQSMFSKVKVHEYAMLVIHSSVSITNENVYKH